MKIFSVHGRIVLFKKINKTLSFSSGQTNLQFVPTAAKSDCVKDSSVIIMIIVIQIMFKGVI